MGNQITNFYQGATLNYTVYVTDLSGDPVSVDGGTLFFTMKSDINMIGNIESFINCISSFPPAKS